ncbi:MAG: hypothetical protein MHM6MM_006217 [Cercozoa sp. M6MM]
MSQTRTPSKILVAYDGSAPSDFAFEFACKHHIQAGDEGTCFAVQMSWGRRLFGVCVCSVHLVCVRPEPPVWASSASKQEYLSHFQQVQEQLENKKGSLFKTLNLEAEVHVQVGDAREVLCELASEYGIDCVVIGSHGKSRMSLGSVSQYVVAHAPCAVTVVRNPVS